MAKKSPFPGMDPYLEAHWGDVHHRLVQYASDQLQVRLPEPLRARVEERVYLETEAGSKAHVYPDVRIIERGRKEGVLSSAAMETEGSAVAVAEPLVIRVSSEPITEGFIEIRDRSNGSLVTVIEVLSPANKLGGRGTKEYRRKQRRLLNSDVSLVEIDLLRGGTHSTAIPIDAVHPSERTRYHVCVHRSWAGPDFEYYRVPLRERLPIIRIPLRQTDQDVTLDLQALLHEAYEKGRYDDLDYSRELEFPLNSEDARWAAELLRAAR